MSQLLDGWISYAISLFALQKTVIYVAALCCFFGDEPIKIRVLMLEASSQGADLKVFSVPKFIALVGIILRAF